MMKISLCTLPLLLAGLAAHSDPGRGEAGSPDPTSTVLERDAVFWKAFNDCDFAGMREGFARDVEFYHDKSGVTVGVDGVMRNTRDNLCSNPDVRVRREEVEGSVRVFPMKDGEELYGAVVSGEHLFYVTEAGRPERAEGLARFTHLWLLEEGSWVMSRVLSFDHGPAPHVSDREAVAVSDDELDRCVGVYRGARSGEITVRREGGVLVMGEGDRALTLHPKGDSVYFTSERDLTFEFQRDEVGQVTGMVVREGGEVAEEAARVE